MEKEIQLSSTSQQFAPQQKAAGSFNYPPL
jgi:hypothetical protein